jgi:hypothetical protein
MKKYLILIFLLVFIACNKSEDYLYANNPPAPDRVARNIQIKDLDNKVDIIWVVDNSGSMSGIQRNIVRNSVFFMDEFLNGNKLNWKMGIISTDENEAPYLGFSTPFDSKLAQSGTVDMTERFEQHIDSLGTSGSPSELVFYSVHRAILNHKFLRPSAHLAIIMVSDEEEQSEQSRGSSFSATNFLSSIRSKVSSDRNIRFYGALDAHGLKGCDNRWNPYKDSPYEEVINATEGFVLSACVDFGQELARISENIATLIGDVSILLKHRPVLDTIEIRYKGVLLPSGPKEKGGVWYYSEKYNAIYFYDLNFAPDFSKDFVTLDYQVDDGIDRD